MIEDIEDGWWEEREGLVSQAFYIELAFISQVPKSVTLICVREAGHLLWRKSIHIKVARISAADYESELGGDREKKW